jgi:hypothetical protein
MTARKDGDAPRSGRYFPCGCWQSFMLGPTFLQVEFCPDHRAEWDASEGPSTRPPVPGEDLDAREG